PRRGRGAAGANGRKRLKSGIPLWRERRASRIMLAMLSRPPNDSASPVPRQPSGFAYRADIDGLRALAVLAVVLTHARLLPTTGGVAGVDIFFVISGFLITSILRDDFLQGRWSVAG